MRPMIYFALLSIGSTTQSCNRSVPENLSDTSAYNTGPVENEDKNAENYYGAVAEVTVRTLAVLPEITEEERDNIHTRALGVFGIDIPVRKGPANISQEAKARYEDGVIGVLTTPSAKRSAKKLPRPWPIWEPPIIWGAPPPTLPEGIGLRL